jgi:hypothetical protein
MRTIIDLKKLHSDLALSPKQTELLSNALEMLMTKYAGYSKLEDSQDRAYFGGTADGLNDAYKLINKIDDDYNLLVNL